MNELIKNKMDDIEFVKFKMPIELDYDYYSLINSQTCTYEESLLPENTIPEKHDYQISELKRKSGIMPFLSTESIYKMGYLNYQIVIELMGNDFTTKLLFQNISAGIDNMLLWEYGCNKKYSIKQNWRKDDKCYSISKATIIFEDELRMSYSKKFSCDFLNPIYTDFLKQYIDNFSFHSKIDSEMLDIISNSSVLLKYFSKPTIYELELLSTQIKVTVNYRSDIKPIETTKTLNGIFDFLLFERNQFKNAQVFSCDPICNYNNKYFRYDEIDLIFDPNDHFFQKHGYDYM